MLILYGHANFSHQYCKLWSSNQCVGVRILRDFEGRKRASKRALLLWPNLYACKSLLKVFVSSKFHKHSNERVRNSNIIERTQHIAFLRSKWLELSHENLNCTCKWIRILYSASNAMDSNKCAALLNGSRWVLITRGLAFGSGTSQ